MSKVNKAEPINHFHYYDIHSFNKNEPQVFLGWGGGGGGCRVKGAKMSVLTLLGP